MEPRILIVDDESMICSVLDRWLSMEGYSCITASNGREALNYFLKDNLSLIITDIKMPEMDGMELLKSVKSMDPNMMVIIMTANLEIDVVVEAMRLGAYDFIPKPADMSLVALSVKKALEKKRLEEELKAHHKNLEQLVEERTAKIQEAYRVLKEVHLDSVRILTGAVDAKDPYTWGHSDRVKSVSVKIGKKLDFNGKKLERLEYGALLHDIGKIGIKDEVLQKPGSLSPEECQHIQEHPLIAARIVAEVDFFDEKIPMIRHHHEHFDGNGYPDKLVGEAIPLEARIISVSDAFDAMTSIRPHRGKKPIEDVLVELERCKGTQFDPYILDIFMKEEIYKSLIIN